MIGGQPVVEASLLVNIGVTSIAVGALSGFVLAISSEKPRLLTRFGVVNRAPIRQVHLDWIIMGGILTAIGVALPDLSDVAVILIASGGIVNPLLFVPGIFSRTFDYTLLMRIISIASYILLSLGLLLAGVAAWSL